MSNSLPSLCEALDLRYRKLKVGEIHKGSYKVRKLKDF